MGCFNEKDPVTMNTDEKTLTIVTLLQKEMKTAIKRQRAAAG